MPNLLHTLHTSSHYRATVTSAPSISTLIPRDASNSGPSPLAIGAGIGGAVLVVTFCLFLGWAQRRSENGRRSSKRDRHGGHSRSNADDYEMRRPERAYRSGGRGRY
ncbi:hypothetical protein LTR08_006904 [Meristemomyces frigidus]|nr:hypothetical protein LTR08_006904 [Meristemomyces frigidus]